MSANSGSSCPTIPSWASFKGLLALFGTVREKRDTIAAQLSRVARQDRIYWLLMTMPGIGPMRALSFMTAIENPWRSRRSQDVGAYLGLAPRRPFIMVLSRHSLDQACVPYMPETSDSRRRASSSPGRGSYNATWAAASVGGRT